MFVPAGYVKLEGGTVNRENYPRLVALADAYNLWTSDTANNPGLFGEGDGATTMVLPNWTGRMAQFAATAGGKVDAGLPNITGTFYLRGMTDLDLPGAVISSADGALSFTWGYDDPSVLWQAVQANNSPKSRPRKVVLDASRSNPIYGNSTTVQPPAINVFAIMRY